LQSLTSTRASFFQPSIAKPDQYTRLILRPKTMPRIDATIAKNAIESIAPAQGAEPLLIAAKATATTRTTRISSPMVNRRRFMVPQRWGIRHIIDSVLKKMK
jgi:hypothetical protein